MLWILFRGASPRLIKWVPTVYLLEENLNSLSIFRPQLVELYEVPDQTTHIDVQAYNGCRLLHMLKYTFQIYMAKPQD